MLGSYTAKYGIIPSFPPRTELGAVKNGPKESLLSHRNNQVHGGACRDRKR